MSGEPTAAPPLHVLIYEPYPFAQVAGNLRTLLYILEHTDPARFRLTLAVPFDTPLRAVVSRFDVRWLVVPPPARLNQYGGKVLRGGVFAKLGHLPALWANILEWRRRLREERVDVIYCNGIRALMMLGVAARLAGVPTVWYVKGTLDNRWLDRLGFLLASRIFFFCAANRDDRYPWLVALRRRDIGIIRIGLDLAPVNAALAADGAALDQALGLRPETLSIACVGQLYPNKGVHFLIEAFARVAQEFPTAEVLLLGHPVIEEYRGYESELRAQIAAAGLEGRVRFLGWREDVLAVVSRVTMVAHPSLAEGFGRAVLEAMALGRPVVASAVGGLREAIVDGENGFLVPPGDVDALAHRLRTVLADAALRARLGRAARTTVARDFQVADKIADLNQAWADAAHRRPMA